MNLELAKILKELHIKISNPSINSLDMTNEELLIQVKELKILSDMHDLIYKYYPEIKKKRIVIEM